MMDQRSMICLAGALVPRARVFVPTMANESSLLAGELAADPERAANVTFVGVRFPSIDRIDYLSVDPKAHQLAYFMSPSVRRGLAEGRAELRPADYLGIARHQVEGRAPDVAIAKMTRAGAAPARRATSCLSSGRVRADMSPTPIRACRARAAAFAFMSASSTS